MVLQSNIRVRRYYYVEKDPQVWQASMHHIMMLWQDLELLPALAIQGYQHTLPKNIALLGV
jgi:hypothetical protein